MKFTSEDLMKAMGLSVGDRIKVANDKTYTIITDDDVSILLKCDTRFEDTLLESIVDIDYEILPRPKRIGDMLCDDFEGCDYGCPLEWLCCNVKHIDHNCDISLYNVLNIYKIDDQEIYDLLKARLDKEVEE